MKKVAVAIFAIKNFTPDVIKGLEGLDYIHVDVIDGKFVETLKNNLDVFKILKETFTLPIIDHLIVVNPYDYIEKIIDYINIFLFYYECEIDKYVIINKIKQKKKMLGIAINPDTDVSELEPFLDEIDVVLVMSVYPRKSGQTLIPDTIKKVSELSILRIKKIS